MSEATDFDFPLKGTMTYDLVKKCQKRLLQMAVEIRDIFEENDVPYFIFYGTLLGSVRHKGFVPWDLDFDLCVMEEDYERAISVLNKQLPDKYVIQDKKTDPNYCAFWSKVVDKYSVVTSSKYLKDNDFKYRGLHIDIYKTKRTSKSRYELDVLIENKEYYDTLKDRHLILADEFEGKMTQIKNKMSEAENKVVATEKSDMIYSMHFFLGEASGIFPLKKYPFENQEFYGPNNADAVLSYVYNNEDYESHYMTLPDYDKRDMWVSDVIIEEWPE